MPSGYKCDRCKEFVEQGRMGSIMYMGSPVEQVAVHLPTDNDDEFALNEYTLCADCREKLVAWVERGTFLANFNSISTTSLVSPELKNALSDDLTDLTDLGGVGEDKAKFLKGAGYTSKADLRDATQSDIAEVGGIGNALAARIKAEVGGVEVDE